jgi:muramoyltetrapeptide carboxypeptidase
MSRPPALEPGARVALVAPAGPLRGEEDLRRAEDNVRALGWEPVVGQYVLSRYGYLAGTDDERLSDFNAASRDPRIDAVWCLRGGYGAMRLLDGIDYEAWRRTPKTLIGYSDVTALHAAIARRAELVTFHGPTARAVLTAFSRDALVAAIAGNGGCGIAAEGRTLVPGRASGPLVGGNLALLASLSGTEFAPRYDGAILVLEDVSEAVYRIDRMLTQLRLAGALERCAGIVFGAFTEIPDEPNGARAIDVLLEEVARSLDVPCIVGAPVGHIDDQWTLPLGETFLLDADALSLTPADASTTAG